MSNECPNHNEISRLSRRDGENDRAQPITDLSTDQPGLSARSAIRRGDPPTIFRRGDAEGLPRSATAELRHQWKADLVLLPTTPAWYSVQADQETKGRAQKEKPIRRSDRGPEGPWSGVGDGRS